MSGYILGIDQSTQGTKALLFDKKGQLLCRSDASHKQIVDEKGWVEHDPMEIYQNTLKVVKDLVEKSGINKDDIIGLGISNQRETSLVWDRETGEPVYHAIVWQCSRGESICKEIEKTGYSDTIKEKTGLQLSPYFSAAKIAWVLRNVNGVMEKNLAGELCAGTIDSWLIYKLTEKKEFKTDYSNASRTQLFNISKLNWDDAICGLFGINTTCLPEVAASDSEFGWTDFDGYLNKKVPIHSAMGDSHGALFGQGCLKRGMIKATYGTGSSIMLNIGEKPVWNDKGIVTSIAWKIGDKVNYVYEGNINYTGAVISWLQNDLNMIVSAKETEDLANAANPLDKAYLVPAFSGLGAPYWDSDATGILCGITRTTGRAEMVKAALDSIAYQITDIVNAMEEASGIEIQELRVDGGPTKNRYLMQLQSDLLNIPVEVPDSEELSGMGAAYAAGLAIGYYEPQVLEQINRKRFEPVLADDVRWEKLEGWRSAIRKALTK